MKKILTVLMMVFGLSAVFADSYVAFTDQHTIEIYENDEVERAVIDAAVKSRFEYQTKLGGFSKQQQKYFVQIIVFNDTDVLYEVWVYSANPKIFGISIVDADGNPAGDYHYEASSKTDPVLVGLNFIKEIVLQVNNINKNKVVFTSFEVQDQDQ